MALSHPSLSNRKTLGGYQPIWHISLINSFIVFMFCDINHKWVKALAFVFDSSNYLIKKLSSVINRFKVCFLEFVQNIHLYLFVSSLRKHAYSNTLKILPPKNENFQIKNSDIFQISAQNIDCGYSLEPPRRGGSNEYPQSMFRAEIRKIMYTPLNSSFTV